MNKHRKLHSATSVNTTSLLNTKPNDKWWSTFESMILNAKTYEARLSLAEFFSNTLPLILGCGECSVNIVNHLNEESVYNYIGPDKTEIDLLEWLVIQHNMVNRDKSIPTGLQRPRQYTITEVLSKYKIEDQCPVDSPVLDMSYKLITANNYTKIDYNRKVVSNNNISNNSMWIPPPLIKRLDPRKI